MGSAVDDRNVHVCPEETSCDSHKTPLLSRRRNIVHCVCPHIT